MTIETIKEQAKLLGITDVVKPFYCHSKEAGGLTCGTQCLGCDVMERNKRQNY